MKTTLRRRDFLKQTAAVTGLAACSAPLGPNTAHGAIFGRQPKPLYRVSLAEWSLNKSLFGGRLDHLDFPKVARRDCGIDAVEYVNQFFKDKATDGNYLKEMRSRADGEGVRSLLIMIDGEGELGAENPGDRSRAVQNHYKWVEAARFLSCHSIRVNAATGNAGTYEEQMWRAADGLSRLADFAQTYQINVIVENHGGLSSNGQWLAGVMSKVNMRNCGTLPDFGNFQIQDDEWYDRYQGVRELMPFAKAVSAKSHDFDENGDEINTDFRRMMKIVVDAGYHGYVGVEYEGRFDSEMDGIKSTKFLLERIRGEMTQ